MKRDDILWKSILENTFDDFLRFFFENADELFDINKGFTFLDKELDDITPAENLRAPKFVDKLIKVYTRSGDYVLFHVEIQGYRDRHFEQRMFTYISRLIDKYKRPVVAIAILTDKSTTFRPVAYQYDYEGMTSIVYQFTVYKVLDQKEEALLNDKNPFAILILMVLLALKHGEITDEELLDCKARLAKNLLSRKLPIEKCKHMLRFLKYYVCFQQKETNYSFDSIIHNLTNKKYNMNIEEFMIDRAKKEGIAEGIEQGVQKGRKKGIREGQQKKTHSVVTSLLLNTRFNTTRIAELVDVPETFVQKIKTSLN